MFFFLLTAMSFSCSKEKGTYAIVTLRDMTGLDGCGVLVQLENSSFLEPVKIPAGITLQPGRRAEIRYKYDPRISICMVGPTVEITFLRYL
jgi:hypothetical protein